MPLTLHMIAAPDQPGGGQQLVTNEPLSLGRSLENGWVLEDHDRILSKTHCLIEPIAGGYQITDKSLNGVYVNGSTVALGRGRSQVLSDGDRFRLGNPEAGYYEFSVHLGVEPPAAAPVASPPVSPTIVPTSPAPAAGPRSPAAEGASDDSWRQLLNDEPNPRRASPLQEQIPVEQEFMVPPTARPDPPPRSVAPPPAIPQAPSASGPGQRLPDDWLSQDLDPDPILTNPGPLATDEAIGAPTTTPPPATPPAEPPMPAATGVGETAPPPPTPEPRPQPAAATPVDSEAALAAFLRGAGLDPAMLAGDDQPQALERAGEVFGACLDGLRQVMSSRTSLKNEFRIEQTLIQATKNNPLKFAPGRDEAARALLSDKTTGYSSGEEAFREAFADIATHQVAVLAGMRHALTALLQRFDPARIEARLAGERQGVASFLTDPKSRYWEAFRQLYGDITDEIEDDFHGSFGRAFAQAYEDQVRRQRPG